MANRKDRKRNSSSSERSDMSRHRTDEAAGAEGIDDLAMEAGRQQGREAADDAHEFGGQGGQREGSPEPEGTGYTANTGNRSGSNRGRGSRDRNTRDRMTNDRAANHRDASTTEDTDPENPFA